MVHSSPLPDVALPDVALDRLVPRSGLPAITEYDTGRTVTYAELGALADAAATRLRSRGVGPGSVVELRLPNSIDFAVALLAVSRTGAAACLVGHSLIDAEASRLSALAGATHRVEPDDLAPGPADAFAPADPDSVAAIPFSSGTTGLPKGVELTHRSITANAVQFNAALAASGIGAGTHVAAPLPFSHIYGLNTLLLSSLAAGRHVFTAARFNLAEFARAHRDHAIELSYIAPPIALALANSPNVDPADFASTAHMVCGAAPLSESLARRVEDRLGVVMLQGYGTTESSPVTHVGIAGRTNPGTIGAALPNTQFRVVDLDTGAETPDGQPGELQVRGPQVMRGYLRDPEATRAAITDGWLSTGDIARVNPDGTVTVVDRAKDVFKYRGFQIAPAELEALLLTHPQISDVAVAERGGVPKAFVVKQGRLEEADVIAWVAARVTAYKKVRAVAFVDAIPRNAAGKILRKDL